MTGVTFTVEIDELAARERISALIDRMENPRPFFAAVGERLANSAKENFDRESASDGTPWAPLAPSTIRQRIKRGAVPIKILTVSKKLRASIISQVEPNGVQIGSALPYAAIHQLGGIIDRPARVGKAFGKEAVSIRAYQIDMPARPFLGVSTEDEAEILDLADAWLTTE